MLPCVPHHSTPLSDVQLDVHLPSLLPLLPRRACSASATVHVKAGTPPQVAVTASASKINPDDRVTLTGVATSTNPNPLAFEWTVLGEAASFAVDLFGASLNRPVAVLKRGMLQPGRAYVFQLRATDSDAVTAASRVAVSINAPPLSGFVDVSPTTGTALTTQFRISAPQWTDDVDDLPLMYVFAYVVGVDGGAETRLSGAPGPVNEVSKLLPAGTAITLVAYVSDSRGAVTRSAATAAGEPCVASVADFVVSSSSGGGGIAAQLANKSDALLNAALDAGDTSSFLSNLAVLSSVLSTVADPCHGVNCGAAGECSLGTCLCAPGYSGLRCEVAPLPVHGAYSAWSSWTRCSRACGGGVATRTRSCIAPMFGGQPCSAVGSPDEAVACNTAPCVVEVDGGWSDWSDWGECSNSCPGDRSGDFSGLRKRYRACDSPAPSDRGAPCAGAEVEHEPCNTDLCQGWAKRCPGSSAALLSNPNPLKIPAVECSGHGVCAREPATCREEEGCLAVCECADGWDGAACQRSTESMAEVRAMRDNFLALQSNSLAAADLSSAAAVTQQAETLRNVANVDELTPRSRDLVMDMVAALASATTDAIPETTAASLLTVAIESAMYALSRASSARRRRRLMWALGDAIARRLDVEDPGALADRMKTTVGTVTGAVMRGMVPGDEPVSFSTRGAALAVARTSVSDAASYGTDGGSSLTLTGSGSSGGLGGAVGDVDVQAVTWATNPVSVLCVCVCGCLRRWVRVCFNPLIRRVRSCCMRHCSVPVALFSSVTSLPGLFTLLSV
jgi:hypothetical protein